MIRTAVVAIIFPALFPQIFLCLGIGEIDRQAVALEFVRLVAAVLCLDQEPLGYGFLWNHPGVGSVVFGKNYTEWEAKAAKQTDYWITVDDTPAKILENYTEVTGRTPVMSEELLGLWQCKLRYRTQEEVLGVARKYKELGIPLDVIVILSDRDRAAGTVPCRRSFRRRCSQSAVSRRSRRRRSPWTESAATAGAGEIPRAYNFKTEESRNEILERERIPVLERRSPCTPCRGLSDICSPGRRAGRSPCGILSEISVRRGKRS